MNQSMKVCDIIYPNRKEYKYLVITERDLILHQYYIMIGAKERFTTYKRLRDAHEL